MKKNGFANTPKKSGDGKKFKKREFRGGPGGGKRNEVPIVKVNL